MVLEQRKHITLAVILSVLLYDSTAYAINALVSQDIPLLTDILATEIASKIELTSILAQTAAIVSQVKEYTTVAKTVWGAIDELRNMTPEQLKTLAFRGLNSAFPEARQIYRDIQNISDLDYQNAKAYATFRGILWEEVYGPVIDDMHAGHANLEVLSEAAELRLRIQGKIDARREEARAWEEDCKKSSGEGGFGACNLASQRSQIQSALSLQDMNETELHQLRVMRQQFENDQEKEAGKLYAIDRWMYDVGTFVGLEREQVPECEPGSCLFTRYGDRANARIAHYRALHPDISPKQALEGAWR